LSGARHLLFCEALAVWAYSGAPERLASAALGESAKSGFIRLFLSAHQNCRGKPWPIFYSFAPDFRRNVRLSYGIHASGFAEVEMCWQ
jgi:hypothetical protein